MRTDAGNRGRFAAAVCSLFAAVGFALYLLFMPETLGYQPRSTDAPPRNPAAPLAAPAE